MNMPAFLGLASLSGAGKLLGMVGIAFFIFQFVVFIFSVIIHEVSHGVVAEKLGDPTARNAGRLTLNPLKHIDPIGSVVLPLFLALTGAPIFGWAKPVPYDPNNLRNPRKGGGLIAAAGPVSNLLLALIFGLLVRVLPLSETMLFAFSVIVYINVLLAIFNLLPIPPLDGSKVFFALLPYSQKARALEDMLNRYGLIILLVFVFFGFGVIQPVISMIFRLITGFSF